MTRPYTPKVITGNRLLEGDVVWRTREGTWSTNLQDAHVYHDETHAQLQLDIAQSEVHEMAGAYLAEVKLEGDTLTSVHFREAFRTRGPSNYFHGKQADIPNEVKQ